jgi:hypothetical protein
MYCMSWHSFLCSGFCFSQRCVFCGRYVGYVCSGRQCMWTISLSRGSLMSWLWIRAIGRRHTISAASIYFRFFVVKSTAFRPAARPEYRHYHMELGNSLYPGFPQSGKCMINSEEVTKLLSCYGYLRVQEVLKWRLDSTVLLFSVYNGRLPNRLLNNKIKQTKVSVVYTQQFT